MPKRYMAIAICFLFTLFSINSEAGFVMKKAGSEQTAAFTTTTKRQTIKEAFHNLHKGLAPRRNNYYLERNGNSFKGAMALLCGVASVAMTTIGMFNVAIYTAGTISITGTTGILLLLGAWGLGILGIVLAKWMKHGMGHAGSVFGIITVAFFVLMLEVAALLSGNFDASVFFN